MQRQKARLDVMSRPLGKLPPPSTLFPLKASPVETSRETWLSEPSTLDHPLVCQMVEELYLAMCPW